MGMGMGMGMGMRMLENNIVTVSLFPLMLIPIFFFFFFFLFFFFFFLFFLFKPWRFFFTYPSSILKGELERPLVGDHHHEDDDGIEFHRDYDLEGACYPNEPHFHGLVHKQRLPPLSLHLNHFQQQQQQQQHALPDTIVLDVLSEDDDLVGHTLKLLQNGDGQPTPTFHNHSTFQHFPQPHHISHQRSCLTLEVISGPSCGLHCSVNSTNPSRLPLTLGRVSPIDLLIKDSEVSGKHALIKWNLDKLKWELVDMGSLNGTLLNSQPINHPDTGSRNWGDPIILANGDVITLGTTSKVMVHITSENHNSIPFGVGMASDPMAIRRGGKKLPMEDVCFYQWPLPGLDQFGIFGICDGHGGDGAAKSASKTFLLAKEIGPVVKEIFTKKLFPEIVVSLLSDPLKRERVLSLCDASDILREAFSQTEACMNHYYEGCTATVLLVWADGHQNFFAQCANVGDSACIMSVNGKQIKLTEDHKITDYSERVRIEETGDPLKEGETRLYGINLGRMLGDKFLKQQDSRFSSEPYISQVLHIHQTNRAFALLASDGLWDVISVKKAIHLVLQMMERCNTEREDSADKIASFLLSEAKTLRTKDNTSVIFIDFDTLSRRYSCKVET